MSHSLVGRRAAARDLLVEAEVHAVRSLRATFGRKHHVRDNRNSRSASTPIMPVLSTDETNSRLVPCIRYLASRMPPH